MGVLLRRSVLFLGAVLCTAVLPSVLVAQQTDGASLPPPAIVPGGSATNLVSDGFMRAMIVDNMNPSMQSVAGIRDLVQSTRLAGFDTLVVQVRSMGDAYYKSSLVPAASGTSGGNGFDPLGTVLSEAHNGGGKPLKVYGLFTTLRVWKDTQGTPPAGHVALTNPRWISMAADGQKSARGELWLDPGVSSVHTYLVNAVQELTKSYALDGIVFDRIRMPDSTLNFGYAAEAVTAYNASVGKSGSPVPTDTVWTQWRKQQMDELMQKLSAGVKGARPECKIAVIAGTGGAVPGTRDAWKIQSEPCARQLQDWVDWCNRGIVDECLLANYKSSAALADYLGWMRFAVANCGKSKVVSCVAGWLNPPDETAAMMLGAVVERGVGGVALYSVAPLRDRGYDMLMAKILSPAVVASYASSVSSKLASANAGVFVLREIVQVTGLNVAGSTPMPLPSVMSTPEPVVSTAPPASSDEDVLMMPPPSVTPDSAVNAVAPLESVPALPALNELGQFDLMSGSGAMDIGSAGTTSGTSGASGSESAKSLLPSDVDGRSKISLPGSDGVLSNYNGERVIDENAVYQTPKFDAPKITTVNDLGAYTEQGVPVSKIRPIGRSRSKEIQAQTGFRSYVDRPASGGSATMPDPSVLQNPETITLKSGRSFNGKVVKRTPAEWTVRLPNGSEIRLQTSTLSTGAPIVLPPAQSGGTR